MRIEDIDDRDRAILRELMRDGRLTNAELADRVHLSQSACLRRVRMLEESGLIAGYVMLLDPAAAGLPGAAFVSVTLDQQGRAALDRFETEARAPPRDHRMLSARRPRRLSAARRVSRRARLRAHPHRHPHPIARRVARAVDDDPAHGEEDDRLAALRRAR